MHAYIPDIDSEERAVPVGQMAPPTSVGYQQIPQSRPQSAHRAESTAPHTPALDEDNGDIQRGNKRGTRSDRLLTS